MKSDWELFRELLPVWQERYMSHLLDEYRKIMDSEGEPSERYHALEERIRKDRKSSGVSISIRGKDDLLLYLRLLLADHVITMDDLQEFSEDTRKNLI